MLLVLRKTRKFTFGCNALGSRFCQEWFLLIDDVSIARLGLGVMLLVLALCCWSWRYVAGLGVMLLVFVLCCWSWRYVAGLGVMLLAVQRT